MRPYGSAKTLERRRRRAAALLESGLTLEAVARRVGASVSSVCRWKQTLSEGGEAALAPKPVPGRPRKLKDAECQQLLELLLRGALAYGFANDLWTLKRIARVICKEFGVKYHPNHVWRLLRAWDWSCQVPERCALQRDQKAIAHWKRYRWPHIKKRHTTWGPSGLSR
jgi:transposase